MEKNKKEVCVVRITYLSLMGSLCFILDFLFDSYDFDNKISLFLSMTNSP